MSAPVPPFPSLEQARAAARRLHQDLRSADPARAQAAAARCVRLRTLAHLSPAELLAEPGRVRRKHALSVIAEEHGAASWVDLGRRLSAPVGIPEFHAPALGDLLHAWFTTHAEAKAAQAESGGYVLPFRTQCFLASAEAIATLGLDPDHPDWRAVGFDLVAPADPAAAARLHEVRRRAIAAGIAPPAARNTRR